MIIPEILKEQLSQIANSQPVFDGDLISKGDTKKLVELGLVMYYEDKDLKIKGYKKGIGGYCLTELGKKILRDEKISEKREFDDFMKNTMDIRHNGLD